MRVIWNLHTLILQRWYAATPDAKCIIANTRVRAWGLCRVVCKGCPENHSTVSPAPRDMRYRTLLIGLSQFSRFTELRRMGEWGRDILPFRENRKKKKTKRKGKEFREILHFREQLNYADQSFEWRAKFRIVDAHNRLPYILTPT